MSTKATPQERFWAKVDKRGPNDCWLWTGTVSNGYGRFWYDGTVHKAHRVAYEWFIGPIPEGYDVDHVKRNGCTSGLCVNPAHLEAVTSQENHRRSGIKRPVCPKGHNKDVTGRIGKFGGCKECYDTRVKSQRKPHARLGGMGTRMTNDEFAESIGRTFTFASRLRNGRRLPSVTTLNRIITVFGLDYAEANTAYALGPEAFGLYLRRKVFDVDRDEATSA